jgi:hypothetical protein
MDRQARTRHTVFVKSIDETGSLVGAKHCSSGWGEEGLRRQKTKFIVYVGENPICIKYNALFSVFSS